MDVPMCLLRPHSKLVWYRNLRLRSQKVRRLPKAVSQRETREESKLKEPLKHYHLIQKTNYYEKGQKFRLYLYTCNFETGRPSL